MAAIAVGACASEAGARARLRPRIGPAMGIVPPVGEQQEIAISSNLPVVYHGGQVMRGPVRVHTVFWAPAGYRFTGPPGPGIPGYEPMIEQFVADSASDSQTLGNVYSVLREYPDRFGAGQYALRYRPAVDSIDDRHPYPSRRKQCASPSGTATCVTDLEVQRELDRLIGTRPPLRHGGRGLGDLWFVLLPPNVDSCIAPGGCGSNAFAGYHSLSNVGHGPVIYSLIIDPLIELPNIPGADPRGNPEAESSIDTVAHEAVEAITDPKGVGWMDPNGFEVADKCEDGPQVGTPLGTAPNGSVYNQLIGGHQYLIQGMWSNTRQGCVTHSRSNSSPLPLATVSLDQFSSLVRGRIGTARGGVPVHVSLSRAGRVVARGSGRTRADGSWGPVSLGSHAVGDDRDVLVVRYGRGGGRDLNTEQIETGSGGNPFTASGWTGWFALDHGYQVRRNSILLSPCAQTGVLRVLVNGSIGGSPLDVCQTETDVSVVPTPRIGTGTSLRMSSEDNRASTPSNRNGALVQLTIPLGEPGAITSVGNDQIFFEPSGFPSCTAELRIQMVRCSGLLPGARYTAVRRRGRAVARAPARTDGNGDAFFSLGIRGGDVVALVNGGGRVLTRLHVAHLRVDIRGNESVISTGRCQPGEYYGPPLEQPPTSGAVGSGVSGTGTICPLDGDAAGLPASQIVQSDEFSGGTTTTQVPLLEGTAPADDATLYGPFVALARTGLPGAHGSMIPAPARVALTISPGGGGGPVFRASNVGVSGGVAVRGLPAGAYVARWVVVDANGDTRAVTTHFVEAG